MHRPQTSAFATGRAFYGFKAQYSQTQSLQSAPLFTASRMVATTQRGSKRAKRNVSNTLSALYISTSPKCVAKLASCICLLPSTVKQNMFMPSCIRAWRRKLPSCFCVIFNKIACLKSPTSWPITVRSLPTNCWAKHNVLIKSTHSMNCAVNWAGGNKQRDVERGCGQTLPLCVSWWVEKAFDGIFVVLQPSTSAAVVKVSNPLAGFGGLLWFEAWIIS